MEHYFDEFPVLFWSEGHENCSDPLDPFGPLSGWAAGFWSWLLDALFGVSGVQNAGLVGSLGAGFLQCASLFCSFIGLILGVPVGIGDGGRGGVVSCCAPLSLLSEIAEII